MTARLCPNCHQVLASEPVGPKQVPLDYCHRCDLAVPTGVGERARHLAAVPDPRPGTDRDPTENQ